MSLAIEGDLRFKEGKPAGCNVYYLGGEVTEFQAGGVTGSIGIPSGANLAQPGPGNESRRISRQN
jgi:hypothetical protein